MSWPLRTFAACLIALMSAGIAAQELASAPVPAAVQLEDERRMREALARLQPQRPGIVDAYVVVAALDADPVFGREAREAGRVLARRFDAQGRTLVLAGNEGSDKADAAATPQGLARALASVATRMDRNEDVLVL